MNGLYGITSKGRIVKILHPAVTKDGYLFQNLLDHDGKKKTHRIHRLVAEVFIDNPDNLPEVNHIDENKTNNCVDNLEWCTHKYNCNHGTRIERMTKSLQNREDCSRMVQCIETGIIYPSMQEAERQTGIDRRGIGNCCRRSL